MQCFKRPTEGNVKKNMLLKSTMFQEYSLSVSKKQGKVVSLAEASGYEL